MGEVFRSTCARVGGINNKQSLTLGRWGNADWLWLDMEVEVDVEAAEVEVEGAVSLADKGRDCSVSDN